jgi:hypothetical protein
MAYSLQDFCTDTRGFLRGQPVASALPQIAERLGRLLDEPTFVAATFGDDTAVGKRVLYHDPDTDFYVLAHVQEGNKVGKPHSHGTSWAVYGNARECTEMTEWRRVNPEGDDHAELVPVSNYRLEPGQTRAYGPGVIHSTAHPHKAWVIRITGTDLDHLPRYHFGKKDRMLERA